MAGCTARRSDGWWFFSFLSGGLTKLRSPLPHCTGGVHEREEGGNTRSSTMKAHIKHSQVTLTWSCDFSVVVEFCFSRLPQHSSRSIPPPGHFYYGFFMKTFFLERFTVNSKIEGKVQSSSTDPLLPHMDSLCITSNLIRVVHLLQLMNPHWPSQSPKAHSLPEGSLLMLCMLCTNVHLCVSLMWYHAEDFHCPK